MKQIIASVFFDILSYTIRNIIFCIFKNFEFNLITIPARAYKLRLAKVNFLSCFILSRIGLYFLSLNNLQTVVFIRKSGLDKKLENLKNYIV